MPTPSARLDSIESTSNTDTFAGASISPTGGALLVVCIGVLRTQTGDPTVASVTDTFTGTGSWTIVQATQTASNQMVGAIAYALLGSTPGSGAVTVTLDLASVRTTIDIYEVTDHGGVNQSKTNIGTGTTLTVTFDSSPASDSLVIGTVANRVTSDIDVTPGTDFTELGELFSSGPSIQMKLQTEYDAAGADTTTDWSDLEAGACVGVAIEILAGGGGDLSVSVSESVGISESLGDTVSDPQAIATDSTTLSESLVALLLAFITASENVSVSEAVEAAVSSSLISVNDSVNLSESVLMALLIDILPSDNVSLSEAIVTRLQSFIGVSDSVSLSESIGLEALFFTSTSGNVSLSESVSLSLGDLLLSVSDSLSLTESVNLTILTIGEIVISVSDGVTISETLNLSLTVGVSVSDGITLAESITVALGDLTFSISDNLSVSEAVSLLLNIFPTTSDSVTLAESVTTAVSDPLPIVSDSVSLAEALAISLFTPGAAFTVTVSDGIAVSDVITMIFVILAMNIDNASAVVFRDKRSAVVFRDKRSHAAFRDKRSEAP